MTKPAAGAVGGQEDYGAEEVSLEDAVAALGGDSSEADNEETPDDDDEEQVDAETEDDESEDESDEEESDDEESEEEASGPKNEKLKDLIDKAYGGDEEAFVKGLREGWKHSAETAKRLEKLEKLLEKPDPEPTPEVDLSQFDEELTSLQEEYKELQQEENQLLKELGDLDREQVRIATRLEGIDKDDPKYDALQAQLASKVNRTRDVAKAIRDGQKGQKKLERQFNAVVKKRSAEEESQKKQFLESHRNKKDADAAAVEEVDTAIDNLFDANKVPAELRPKLGRTLKSEVITYLNALDSDRAADLTAVTNTLGKDLLETINSMSKSRLAKGAGDKLKASRRTASVKKKGDSRTTSSRPKTSKGWREAAQESRDYARRILGD